MRVKSLQCRICKKEFQAELNYVCNECFGPLDVIYNLDKINLKKIKLIALHQASKYICDNIRKKLNINKIIFFNKVG